MNDVVLGSANVPIWRKLLHQLKESIGFRIHGGVSLYLRVSATASRKKCYKVLRLLELARVLVRFDHVARFIVNAYHSIM